MTRQMADDEVLRVLDALADAYAVQVPQFYAQSGKRIKVQASEYQAARAAVAALQAERDALREAAIGATDKLQAERIEARELRKQRQSWINHVESVGCTYVATTGLEGEPVEALFNTRAERAESALEALRGQVAGLVEAADAITFDTYALTAPETRAAFDGRESIAVVRIDTLDAFRTELLAIKERMG